MVSMNVFDAAFKCSERPESDHTLVATEHAPPAPALTALPHVMHVRSLNRVGLVL